MARRSLSANTAADVDRAEGTVEPSPRDGSHALLKLSEEGTQKGPLFALAEAEGFEPSMGLRPKPH
jgi:hypothetical protein